MHKALQFWGISFVLLFVLSQILEWLQQANLPFPVFVMAGVGLAAWSNADKRKGFPFEARFNLVPPAQSTSDRSSHNSSP